jgi:DNA mismatch endonuclease (patch repair protein)
MADFLSKQKRSKVMAAIRSTGNKATELKLMRILRSHHITGWRRKQKVFGNPDFVFRNARLAVFVDGCFWHGCPKHLRMPKSRKSYWKPKIIRNKRRDLEVSGVLRKQGWAVVRIWEHDLKNAFMTAQRIQTNLARSA